MPHVRLEVSDNAAIFSDWTDLFHEVHGVLHHTGGIKLENCKSRAYVAENYLVGAGREQGAFAHLDVRFLEGRSEEIKQQIGRKLLELMLWRFEAELDRLDLQITVEIRDIERGLYYKHPRGSISQL